MKLEEVKTAKKPPSDDMLEKLAGIEHEGWARWQKYLHSVCTKGPNGTLIIPKDKVDRWERQINTKYEDLSDKEKESDRKEVRKLLPLVKGK